MELFWYLLIYVIALIINSVHSFIHTRTMIMKGHTNVLIGHTYKTAKKALLDGPVYVY